MEKYGVSITEHVINLLPLEPQTKVRMAIQLAMEIHQSDKFAFNILVNETTNKLGLQIQMGQYYTGQGDTVEEAAASLYEDTRRRAEGVVRDRQETIKNAVATRDRATAAATRLEALIKAQTEPSSRSP